MNQVINFIVTIEEEGGYSASAVNASIITQGETLDELVKNIKDAVELHFEDDNLLQSPFFNVIYSDQAKYA